jgi:hypothetical protein
MVYTLKNITHYQKEYSIVEMKYVMGVNTKNKYQLINSIKIELSNKDIITIPSGFIWDLASVPRILWSLLPPDGDFTLGFLIHDYLYSTKSLNNYTRKFCDDEMLIWTFKTSGTSNPISFRNIDIFIRYYGVRLFGWVVWKDIIKIK